MGDLELLQSAHPLGYEDGKSPELSLPPTDPACLNIPYGSCRKPHGQGPDMLATADTMLKQDRAPETWVHQLLLTSDQIYAGDVSLSLLQSVRANAQALLNLHADESIPTSLGPVGFDDPVAALFTGGQVSWPSRQIRRANITTTD